MKNFIISGLLVLSTVFAIIIQGLSYTPVVNANTISSPTNCPTFSSPPFPVVCLNEDPSSSTHYRSYNISTNVIAPGDATLAGFLTVNNPLQCEIVQYSAVKTAGPNPTYGFNTYQIQFAIRAKGDTLVGAADSNQCSIRSSATFFGGNLGYDVYITDSVPEVVNELSTAVDHSFNQVTNVTGYYPQGPGTGMFMNDVSVTLDPASSSDCSITTPNLSTSASSGKIVITYTITANTDSIADPGEYCIVHISDPRLTRFGGNLGEYGTLYYSVIDNSPPVTVSSSYTTLPTLTENPNLPAQKGQFSETITLSSGAFVAGDQVVLSVSEDCLISPNNFSGVFSEYTYDLTQGGTQTVYIKALTDSLIEGTHSCLVVFSHVFVNTDLNFTDTKVVTILDYTPNFEAKATETLYEKPQEQTAQSSTGSIDIKLLDLPSDNVPVKVTFVNQSSQICEILSGEFMFDQSNYNIKQSINVRAIKDGVYQPEVRKCLVKLVFSSSNGANTNQSRVNIPNYELASYKKFQKAAIEYDTLSYVVSINVLDADSRAKTTPVQPSLIQTGRSQFPVFGAIVIALSTIGMISNYGFKRRKLIALTAEPKIRNIYF